MLCFGLFPFSAQAHTGLEKHATASHFDAVARSLSAAFALAGLACLLLACVEIPRAKLRAALVVVLVPHAVAVAMASATILHAAHANDVVSVLRHSRVLTFDQELRIERAVNDLYCHAQTRALCDAGDIENATTALGFESKQQTEVACTRTHGQGWAPFALDPLTLIADPTPDAMHWCGQYVVATTDALDTTQSPYQQHQVEVIDALLHARTRRRASTKLLMVLEWFASPAFFALVWWLHSLSTKLHSTVSMIV
jgi:hypothetical protein